MIRIMITPVVYNDRNNNNRNPSYVHLDDGVVARSSRLRPRTSDGYLSYVITFRTFYIGSTAVDQCTRLSPSCRRKRKKTHRTFSPGLGIRCFFSSPFVSTRGDVSCHSIWTAEERRPSVRDFPVFTRHRDPYVGSENSPRTRRATVVEHRFRVFRLSTNRYV